GISFHRNKRSKGTFRNELEDIRGIGKATAEHLLKKYNSVKNIRETNQEEIEKTIGKSKAMLIGNYFNKDKK
ncbi:MAG: helix-hairpin-helix domain-containing protein, partial [Chitinophagaceae bacterium]